MSNMLGKKFSKGKIQIILIGGGGAPLSIAGIECNSNSAVNEVIAIGYNPTSVAEMPAQVVTAVVIFDTSSNNISGLNLLYEAHKVNKIVIGLEATLEASLFTKCQQLFGWSGSLSNYFIISYI